MSDTVTVKDTKENPIAQLRASLAQSASTTAPTATTRRSPRKRPRPDDDPPSECSFSFPGSPATRRSSTRELTSRKSRDRSPVKSKRGYASPETYAHLNVLQDYLCEELDVVFCGINPGYMSAKVGHHFANPTNHFWKCLHQSGLTSRLLLPSEDSTLPEQFCLGMTDLVDRPSTEQAELSKKEMAESVPSLLAKISRYRPRIVCFVGVGIWDIFLKGIKSIASSPPAVTATPPRPLKKKRNHKAQRGLCLQEYKVVHPNVSSTSSVQETLFFVVPSTSGRVVSHQLPDKVKLFMNLKECVDGLKEAKIQTSNMAVIGLPTLDQ